MLDLRLPLERYHGLTENRFETAFCAVFHRVSKDIGGLHFSTSAPTSLPIP